MSDIVKFDFHGKSVRVVLVETPEGSHEEWIAKDVCEALEIDKHRDAMSRLDEDERGSVVVDTLGGPQETSTVTEAGLYSLILRSRKPSAKAFKRWVTHEVLPQIRKTGHYVKQWDEERVIGKLTEELVEQRRISLEQGQQITQLLSVVSSMAGEMKSLMSWRASRDKEHPHGMTGKRDAKVLRGQITYLARIRQRMGDSRLFLSIYRQCDNEIRTVVNFHNSSGATWDRSTSETSSKAFSIVAQRIAAAEKELSKQEKKRAENAQSELFSKN
jgi:prophage antirepressor-like protein